MASWNLCQRAGDAAARLGGVVADAGGADVVLLQEVSTAGLGPFCEAAGLDWGVHLHDVAADLLWVRGRMGWRPPEGGRRSAPPRSVALAGRGAGLRSPVVFPDLPLPEKVLAGWLDLGGVRTTVVTYHAPTGVQHGPVKPAQAVRVAEWLAMLDGPVIFGGDFNTPEVDHPDAERLRTHFHTGGDNLAGRPGDDLLVGAIPAHGLRDALRTWLTANPEELAAVRTERPDGPLAVSYRTGDGDHCRFRYDAVWLSGHFEVKSVEYLYEAAIEAGTDHALVLVDVDLVTAGSGR